MGADLPGERGGEVWRAAPVAIVHPGRQHAYEAVLAAQQAGLLRAFVTAIYDTRRGWCDRRWWRWLPHSTRRHIDARLANWQHPEIDPALVHGIPAYDLLARALTAPAVPWPSPQARRRVLRWATRRVDAAAAAWVARQRGLRIVHGFEGGALHTFAAARQAGAATVLDVPAAHEYALRWLARAGANGTDAHMTLRLRAERAQADFLLAPSQWVASNLREHDVPADRVVLLPYGVNIEAFRPHPGGRTGGPFRVLFVGEAGRRKGIDHLLEAWQRLGLRDAELVIVGHVDTAGAALRAHAIPGVRWIGKVPRADVREWYRASDVFAFPSLAEGSALVTYEALASGLPVVTTLNAGSVVRDGREGFLVPAASPGDLADRIRLLHDQPGLRAAMAHTARETIERAYTSQHYRARIVALYRAILDGRPPQAAVDAATGGSPRD